MHRRHFLTSAASVALAGTRALRAADPTRRLPLGFLGATHSHAPAKLELALRSPDWEVVGVCDPSPAGQKTAERLGARLVSEDELFSRARVIAVESDVRDQTSLGLRALRAGKHVHLEKPGAAKLGDAQALVALAREKGLLLQSGYMWRYHPGFQAIFEAVRAGWLGEVFLVRGHISNLLAPARRPEWAEFAGGSMYELGSHLIDATVRLLGRPKNVIPFLGRHGRFEDSLRDNNVAVLEYERTRAVIFNTALQGGATPPRSFEVLGTKGTATLAPIEPGKLVLDLAEAAGPHRKGAQEFTYPAYRRYVGDFLELAAAVRGERTLQVSLEGELLTAEIVLRASGMT
ncbi:MAG: Gfo/Idh/MocA family oxidoreductase [Verrucomicrobia bacterium]|nr:Gfo/Idh/MocA family oxidoreductase [Verrucomicrobiota bacterium]